MAKMAKNGILGSSGENLCQKYKNIVFGGEALERKIVISSGDPGIPRVGEDVGGEWWSRHPLRSSVLDIFGAFCAGVRANRKRRR